MVYIHLGTDIHKPRRFLLVTKSCRERTAQGDQLTKLWNQPKRKLGYLLMSISLHSPAIMFCIKHFHFTMELIGIVCLTFSEITQDTGLP